MSRLIFAVILIIFPSFYSFSQVFNEDKIDNCSVYIRSGECKSSGFFWKDGSHVVTNLHSIRDKNEIYVWVPENNQLQEATIEKVFSEGDLVLLKIKGNESSFFLSEIDDEPQPINTDVIAFGYQSSNYNVNSIPLQVGYVQGGTLYNLLPADDVRNIKTLSFPNVFIKILFLNGTLASGFSGSPIFNNSNGKLVGISNGALDAGLSGMSWAIPASYLNDLENSVESLPTINIETLDELFPCKKKGKEPQILKFKNRSIRKVKTQTFDQLYNSGNIQRNTEWNNLYEAFDNFNFTEANGEFMFDVYQEDSSGAIFVIPSSYDLIEDNGILKALSPDSTSQIFIEIEDPEKLNDKIDFLERSIRTIPFESVRDTSYKWVADSALSQASSFVRADGTVINRNTYYYQVPNQYFISYIAGNKRAVLGVSANFNNAFNMTTGELVNEIEFTKIYMAVQLSGLTHFDSNLKLNE